MTSFEKAILRTVRYFDFFSYPPTAEEIYLFLSQKKTLLALRRKINFLLNQKKLLELKFTAPPSRYYPFDTLGEYSIKRYNLKKKEASRKKKKGEKYWRLLSFFPQIKFIGISGSVAMGQAKRDDDLDLFIITAPGCLWTGRMIAVVLAWLMGLKRKRGVKRAKNKICLNLFFDGGNLKVPKIKQTEYVGHEIIQMKPVVNKDDTYKYFLAANHWVTKFFPNFKIGTHPKQGATLNDIEPYFGANWWEKIFKAIQLFLINRHRTSERISDTQLWFFPDDFEKKIKSGDRHVASSAACLRGQARDDKERTPTVIANRL